MNLPYCLLMCLCFAMLGVDGCGYRVLTLDRIPEVKGGRPLGAIPPMKFGLHEFGDSRPFEFVYLQPPRHFIVTPKPTQIVEQAIEKELVRNGHTVVRSGDFTAVDVLIEGSVTMFAVPLQSGFTAHGVVEARIATTPTRAPGEPLIKTYRGVDPSGVGFLDLKGLLSGALTEMVKEFTTDPEFLDRITKTKKSP